MSEYVQYTEDEKEYLGHVIKVLLHLIQTETVKLTERKKELLFSGKDMWENSAHFTDDFDRLTEMNQYLQQLQSRAFDYENTKKNILKHTKMLDSPYFGRFDFVETGSSENEKIYIGKGNVTDPKSRTIVVYDWRAPISSMFYRFEPGPASFLAPFGKISGEIKLKRQYKITKSKLKYYFDCSIQISDEILQEVLSRNASPQMRTIIETIQKEQDIIIRDTDNDLLIVQGVAGSGKTSIALHRIAFLLYEGLASKLLSNNILVLSPNNAFSNYIGHVLPELGEENVKSATMEGMIKSCLEYENPKRAISQFNGRNQQLENCISGRGDVDGSIVSQWVQFKGSDTFRIIIDRYMKHFERHLILFEDVYYENRLIVSKDELKSDFLNNKTGMPIAKRLNRMENRLSDGIADLRKERLKRLEGIVQRRNGHELEVKSFARLLLMKDSKTFAQRLKRFSDIDVIAIYEGVFKDRELFRKLSVGLELPDDIDYLLENTYRSIKTKSLYYEDWTAIAYIRLKAFGAQDHSEIKQVVIDEVQDYYPLQLAIIQGLYGDARFTVVGDIAQSIERNGKLSIYDEMHNILKKSKAVRISLNRSYRASFEINEFTKRLAVGMTDCISFPRHEEQPGIMTADSEGKLLEAMIEKINSHFSEGFETVAVLCKTMKEAETLYLSLKDQIKLKLVDGSNIDTEKGCLIMPIYAAKGLEFDAVLVYGVDHVNYCTELDRRLLYVACTRALHRLNLYYTGELNRFI